MQMILSKTSRASLPAMLVMTAFVLAGCNSASKPAQTSAQPSGQVIAKVGTEDVTIHELQNELRHRGVAPDKIRDEDTKATLIDIVRRKSLAQRAQAAGLDREPTVLLDIIRAREQLLAGAILQRDVQAKVGAIGKSDIDRFENANPDSFQQRVRFDVDQVTISAATISPEFAEAVKNAASLDLIEQQAAAAKIPYVRGKSAVFTGDIPPELADRLRKRKDSDIFFVRTGAGGSTFFKVLSETPDPLTGEAAQQRASLALRNQLARDEVNGKSADVQVTYFGTYEKLMAPAATPTKEAPATPAATAPATPAAPPK